MTDQREEETRAVSRIGLSGDGNLLLRMLYRELESVAPRGSEAGALYESEGRRRFARELIELLESEHARERSASDPRPGVYARAEPARFPVSVRGARRPVAGSEGQA